MPATASARTRRSSARSRKRAPSRARAVRSRLRRARPRHPAPPRADRRPVRLLTFLGRDSFEVGRIEGDEAVVGGPLDATGRTRQELATVLGWDPERRPERIALRHLIPAP